MTKIKHGQTRTRLYSLWSRMKWRCHCEIASDYKNYGGRGITVCEEWRNSFESFRDWAMNNGYTDSLSIERENVNGDYCPDNCIWIPMNAQQKNRRNVLLIEGKTVPDWCREYGITDTREISAIRARVARHGWTLKRALTVPVKELKPRFAPL